MLNMAALDSGHILRLSWAVWSVIVDLLYSITDNDLSFLVYFFSPRTFPSLLCSSDIFPRLLRVSHVSLITIHTGMLETHSNTLSLSYLSFRKWNMSALDVGHMLRQFVVRRNLDFGVSYSLEWYSNWLSPLTICSSLTSHKALVMTSHIILIMELSTSDAASLI